LSILRLQAVASLVKSAQSEMTIQNRFETYGRSCMSDDHPKTGSKGS